jgi:hypothetical protein
MIISRHQANRVFLPEYGADFIIPCIMREEGSLFHALSGRILPVLSGNFWRTGLIHSLRRAKSFEKNRYNLTAVRILFIFLGLFSESGKLIMFLYPFSSTGEQGRKNPIRIPDGLKI